MASFAIPAWVSHAISHVCLFCQWSIRFCLPVCCMFAVRRFEAVHGRIDMLPNEELINAPHPDPLTCGYKYNMSAQRTQFRDTWYLPPKGAGAEIEQDIRDGVSVQKSAEGCTKARWERSKKNLRSGLWIWVCMKHQLIVGYHMMPKPEGLRDPIYSLMRFKEKPPKTVFIDFACGCEETSLNWAPSMFKDTQFFHDVFHGMTHVCGERFKSTRFPKYADFITPIMEQVRLVCCSTSTVPDCNVDCLPPSYAFVDCQANFALQPLKGMTKGSKTKVELPLHRLNTFRCDKCCVCRCQVSCSGPMLTCETSTQQSSLQVVLNYQSLSLRKPQKGLTAMMTIRKASEHLLGPNFQRIVMTLNSWWRWIRDDVEFVMTLISWWR